MTGVQLIGKEKVLDRYEAFHSATQADAWGLFQGKEFIAGGTGAETLDGWLTSFETAGSTATYKLRIYDSDDPPTSSTANTDYLACFTFKITDQYEGQGIGGHSMKLMERIGALEKQLKDKDDSDDPEDLGSIVMGWLQDPVKLNQVAGAVRQILGIGGSVGQIPSTPVIPIQTVAGFNVTKDEDPETKLTRLATALDTLEKKDSKLVDHFEKLAKLSESDPLIFNAVISKLDAL